MLFIEKRKKKGGLEFKLNDVAYNHGMHRLTRVRVGHRILNIYHFLGEGEGGFLKKERYGWALN